MRGKKGGGVWDVVVIVGRAGTVCVWGGTQGWQGETGAGGLGGGGQASALS